MILKELKFLLSHSAIYGIGAVITQIVGFVMLPVYTRYLTPSDYGVLELVTVTNSVLSMLIFIGVAAAIIRFYYNYNDITYKNSVISTSIILYAISAVLAALILLNFLGSISYVVIGSKEYARYFKIAFAWLLFGGFINIGDTYLRVNKKPGLYITLTTSRLVSLLSLNIYFVVFAKTGVIGILYSSLLTSLFFSMIIMVPIIWRTGLYFSSDLAKDLLKFSLPLIPSDILRIVINQSDRFFIRTLLSVADTGIFSLAVKLGNVILMLAVYPFNMAFSQRRFEIIKRKDANITFSKVFTYFSLFILFLGLSLSIFSREILIIMTTPQFYSAATLVPFIILHCVAFSFRFHFNFGVFWSKKTYYLLYINIIIAIINLISNYFLIKTFSLFGAVYAKCLTTIVSTTLIYITANRLYKIEYEFKRVFKAFALAILIYILSTLMSTSYLIADVGIKFALLISYPFTLYFFNVITREETIKIKHMIKRPVFLSTATK